MARADFVQRVRSILYGTGPGEKPSIRRAAANANEATSGSTVSFDLLAGEGASVTAGDTLAVKADTADTGAYALYVLSVATDTVTAENGYMGSPSVTGSDSGDLDSALLEQNPLVTTYDIHQRIDTVFATHLWPHVWNWEQLSVIPDLATGEAEISADVMDVLSAEQLHSSIPYSVSVSLYRNRHSTISSTGSYITFDNLIDASAVLITAKTKLAVGDEATWDNLVDLVATGAAALCLGASVSETALEPGNKESRGRGRRDPATTLWRDFLTLRQDFAHSLSLDGTPHIRYHRG